MEWIKALKASIDYMEQHLLEDIHAEDIARQVHMSGFYFQKGFSMVTGYTVGDYLRNRRLYLAALDLLKGEEKVIDIAYKYGYETPESFSKAFKRFHGFTPAQTRKKPEKIQSFQPLIIKILLEGGNIMDVRIEKMDAFKIVGKGRSFSFETGFREIPKFWDEFYNNHRQEVKNSGSDSFGKYGVSIMTEGENFNYYIAGDDQGKVKEPGYEVIEIPAHTWAKFRCVGPMPGAIQYVNTKIYQEWLPGNAQYDIAADINIELYTEGDTDAVDYVSEIWIPVKEK